MTRDWCPPVRFLHCRRGAGTGGSDILRGRCRCHASATARSELQGGSIGARAARGARPAVLRAAAITGAADSLQSTPSPTPRAAASRGRAPAPTHCATRTRGRRRRPCRPSCRRPASQASAARSHTSALDLAPNPSPSPSHTPSPDLRRPCRASVTQHKDTAHRRRRHCRGRAAAAQGDPADGPAVEPETSPSRRSFHPGRPGQGWPSRAESRSRAPRLGRLGDSANPAPGPHGFVWIRATRLLSTSQPSFRFSGGNARRPAHAPPPLRYPLPSPRRHHRAAPTRSCAGSGGDHLRPAAAPGASVPSSCNCSSSCCESHCPSPHRVSWPRPASTTRRTAARHPPCSGRQRPGLNMPSGPLQASQRGRAGVRRDAHHATPRCATSSEAIRPEAKVTAIAPVRFGEMGRQVMWTGLAWARQRSRRIGRRAPLPMRFGRAPPPLLRSGSSNVRHYERCYTGPGA